MNLIPEQISVGILSSKEITFRLKGQYQLFDNLFEGELSVSEPTKTDIGRFNTKQTHKLTYK